jgi:hypothetical protein
MRIPSDLVLREAFYDDVIAQCEKSQEARRINYDRRRQFYLRGADSDSNAAPFNKAYPHLDTVLSFLFASETTKFSVIPAPGEVDIQHQRTGIFGDAINEKWHESNADIIVSNAILWGLIFDTMIVKVLPKVNRETKSLTIEPFHVHPAAIGVYREDVTFFSRQQAIVQTYSKTEGEISEMLASHPYKEEILAALSPAESPDGGGDSSNTMMGVMMGAWQPVGNPVVASGNLSANLSSDFGYQPEQVEGMRTLKELWIWDDGLNDYRVVTRPKDGGFSIFDVENPYLPGEHPFIQFCPRPLPFYVYGESEMEGLIELQRWRNEYITKIRAILARQLEPPAAASGFGILEEGAYAKWIEGSFLPDNSGGMGMSQKVETFAPQMPPDAYRMISEIDNSFNEHSGLPNTVQGKGDVGVRSGKQASELARLGSARIKKRALIIEDALEKMAHLYAMLMQKHDTTTYADATGAIFVLSQFTKLYEVKVDSHSSSPVFMEDKRELAFALLNAGLITPERALQMIDPPDRNAMLHDLPKIQAAKAAAAQSQEQAELKRELIKHADEGFIKKMLAKVFGA